MYSDEGRIADGRRLPEVSPGTQNRYREQTERVPDERQEDWVIGCGDFDDYRHLH